MSKIISFFANKGGTGKSTITATFATYMSQIGDNPLKNKKILLIDADGQMDLTSYLYTKEHNNLTIGDALVSDLKAEDVIIKGFNELCPNLDIIPSNRDINLLEEMLSKKVGREKIARRWFRKNKEILKEYDYIFIDINASAGLAGKNFLHVCDSIVFLLGYTENASARTTDDFIREFLYEKELLELEDEELKLYAILNKYTVRKTTATGIFEEELGEYPSLSEKILDNKIHDSIVIKNAVAIATPVDEYIKQYGGNKRAVEDVEAVLTELMSKGVL